MAVREIPPSWPHHETGGRGNQMAGVRSCYVCRLPNGSRLRTAEFIGNTLSAKEQQTRMCIRVIADLMIAGCNLSHEDRIGSVPILSQRFPSLYRCSSTDAFRL